MEKRIIYILLFLFINKVVYSQQKSLWIDFLKDKSLNFKNHNSNQNLEDFKLCDFKNINNYNGDKSYPTGFSMSWRGDIYFKDKLIIGRNVQNNSNLSYYRLDVWGVSRLDELETDAVYSNLINAVNANITTATISSANITTANIANIPNRLIIGGTSGLNVGTHKLAVNGSIICTEANVKLTANWPDYVFEEDYQLPSLTDLEKYIKENKHLPEIPSAERISQEGLSVGEMLNLQMKKIEELTLYIIEQQKEIENLKNRK